MATGVARAGTAYQPTGMSAWLNVNVHYWRFSSVAIALLILAPTVIIFSAWLEPASEVWRHLADTILARLVVNTLLLVLGVSLGVLVTGVGLAWLVSMCEFPGRRFFDWALMLPLAIPAYVLAFVLVGLLDFSGVIPTFLRSLGLDWFPQIRSRVGVTLVMILAFYPYVYMLARTAFLSQGRNLLDSGRVLGLNAWGAFFKVALPMARPAIAAGVALAVMETLADFGAVSVFNYDTFTTAIYKSWMGLFNLNAAAQLASILLLFVLMALFSERHLRKQARYTSSKSGRELRYLLKGRHAWLATGVSALVLIMAFVIPVIQLLVWVSGVITADLDARYFGFFGNTMFLGLLAAGLTAFGALMLSYTYRLKPDRLMKLTLGISTMGYALPGSVLAVGMMLTVVAFDQQIVNLAQKWFDLEVQQVLTGTVIVLILAYVVRFMAVAHGPIDTAFERVKPSILQAARSLGANNWRILWGVSMPMLKGGMLSAMLLVFVEVMKEMPATLLLRPFGWDTLATRIFEMTSEGEWERAALPSVTLIIAGLVPVIMLVRRSSTKS